MRRRDFVGHIAGSTAVGFFGASLIDLEAAGRFAAAAPADQPYEFLKPDQVRLLDAVTAQIVPTDDTPGAREAHVVRFIDHAFATFLKPRQPFVVATLATFDTFARGWHSANMAFDQRLVADQVLILQGLERDKPPLFNAFRRWTMWGMFSHPEHGGNFGRTGWKMIGFTERYAWSPPFGYYDR